MQPRSVADVQGTIRCTSVLGGSAQGLAVAGRPPPATMLPHSEAFFIGRARVFGQAHTSFFSRLTLR
jgi:hypothetical protein